MQLPLTRTLNPNPNPNIVRCSFDATPDIDDRAGGTLRPAGDCVFEVNRGRRESGKCGARTRLRESACRSQKNRFYVLSSLVSTLVPTSTPKVSYKLGS